MMPGLHGTASLEIVLAVFQIVMVFHRKQNVDGMVCHVEGYETIFYDDKCYVWFAQEKWNRSHSKKNETGHEDLGIYFCSQRGLELPRIDDFQATVKALMSKAYFKMTFRGDSSLWLGAMHHEGSKQFRWDDNNEFVALDVLSGEQRRKMHGNCVVLTSALLVQTKQCSGLAHTMCMAISPRYFGKDETLKCNCMGAVCSVDGDCWKYGGHCKPGWFGKLCQKRDLLFDVENPLTDLDDQTCVPNTSSPQTFHIHPPNYLLWLRIVLKNKGQLDGFQVDVVSNNKATGNVGRKEIVITDQVIDIWCGTNITHVTRVILRWRSKKTICSVHVFGGLNVALKQTSSQSSTHQEHGPGNAVDGEYGLLSPSAVTRMEDPVQRWTLEMASLTVVLEVVVYLKSPQAENMMDVNLTLKFDSLTSNRIGRNNDLEFLFRHGETRVSIPTKTLEVVHSVKISRREDEVSKGNLDLSEVEVYGECAPPYFGILCEKRCNNNCKGLSCHFNGECYECVPGTSGAFCRTTTTQLESAGTSPEIETRGITTAGFESSEFLETTGNSKTEVNVARQTVTTTDETILIEALLSNWTTPLSPDNATTSNESSTATEPELVTSGQMSMETGETRDNNMNYFAILFVLVLAMAVVGVTWTVINQKSSDGVDAARSPDTTDESSAEEEAEDKGDDEKGEDEKGEDEKGEEEEEEEEDEEEESAADESNNELSEG